jgi:phage shock protein PspC (stress-responsive transcriptional regulator)
MKAGRTGRQSQGVFEMPQVHPNPLMRDDTLLGVCQALGEDFGFSPNWLRVALAVSLFVNPLAAIGAYLAMGLLVAASRFAFPSRAPADAAAPALETAEAVHADTHEEPLAHAA